MFKRIKNLIRSRREQRIRETLIIELLRSGAAEYNVNYVNRAVKFILDGNPE